MRSRNVFLLALMFLSVSCNDLIDITPYDTLPPAARSRLNEENISRWRQQGSGNGSVTLALTSDPHFYYGDLSDIVSHINGNPAIEAVIVAGDLTDQALVNEFEMFTTNMERLVRPWIALIGNHDHMANGRIIYEQMFGPRNFFVDHKGYRFIFFDDTVWEADAPPDVDWLSATLAGRGDNIPIVIAHIPTHSDQLELEYGQEMRDLFEEHHVPMFIHGHQHGFRDDVPFDDGVRYLSIPWPRTRQYLILRLQGDEFHVERVFL